MFVDKVTLNVRAGKGGDGLTSWRREKFIAKGGPDGGDGGKGGDVVIETDHNLNTLASLRNKPLIKAKDGERGKRKKAHGKNGEDVVVKVPLGTTVWHKTQQLVDLSRGKEQIVAAAGGKGGFGNAHFTSSVRQAPELSELGEPGESKELTLELKLIADVGLVGLPNAGKSTLLSVISNARPEIADYPFTTTSPNLGVAQLDSQSFLVADIPGLIEGASQGKGLGDEFLRHIERTSILLHLIDVTSADVLADWKTINQELAAYKGSGDNPQSVDLSNRPQIIVLTKIDAAKPNRVQIIRQQLAEATDAKIMAISAVTHLGVKELLRATWQLIAKTKAEASDKTPEPEPIPHLTMADDPDAWWVEKDQGKFVVKGSKIEGFSHRTDFNSPAGMERFRDIMSRWGITRELIRLGIKNGDVISIAGKEFKW